MRFPFTKKEDGENERGDEYRGDEYPAVQGKGVEKSGSVLIRIALYGGVFIVLVAAAGGYYYLNYTRGSLNKRISGNPSGLVKAIDLGGGENSPASGDAPFIEGQSNETREPPRPSSSNGPARQASPVGDTGGAAEHVQARPEAPFVREGSASSKTVPPSAKKTSRDASPDQPETLLSQLVLRDDNPFRDKFLKKFQDSQVPKMFLKNNGRSAKSGQPSRFSQSARTGKAASGLTGGELAILPDIAGGGDRPGDLKVMGVIQTQETAVALTNKGELKVGSMVDGDAVTGITMNEVRLKSGRALKVTAQ